MDITAVNKLSINAFFKGEIQVLLDFSKTILFVTKWQRTSTRESLINRCFNQS